MSNILRRVKGSAEKLLPILENERQDRKCITVNDIKNILLNGSLSVLQGKAILKFLKPITKGRSPALA